MTRIYQVGKDIIDRIEQYARVPCGYSGIKDVRKKSHEDRMDSFFLAEMFKYLYLLFEEEENLTIDPQNYVFTTEAHMLPLELSNFKNHTAKITPYNTKFNFDGNPERSCPNPLRGRTGTLFQTEELNLWRLSSRNWMLQSSPNFWVRRKNKFPGHNGLKIIQSHFIKFTIESHIL